MDIKNTFDSLKDRAVDLAQAGMAQSKRLAEIARLKMDNMSQQDAIKKAYVEIGKLYYAEKGDTPEGGYAAACGRVTAARAAIESNKTRIDELKQPGDPEDDEPEEEDLFDAKPEEPAAGDEPKE